MLHVGLLLALGSGFWGSPDSSEFRIKLTPDSSSRKAYAIEGHPVALPYELELKDVMVSYTPEGHIADYEADLSVDGEEVIHLKVNHPYNVRFGEDLYLASVSEDSCVLQIVREPWRYFALAGIILMLAGAFLLFVNGPQKR